MVLSLLHWVGELLSQRPFRKLLAEWLSLRLQWYSCPSKCSDSPTPDLMSLSEVSGLEGAKYSDEQLQGCGGQKSQHKRHTFQHRYMASSTFH